MQTEASINDYYVGFTVVVLALIAFGGYFAPMAEVKLGLGCARRAKRVACAAFLRVCALRTAGAGGGVLLRA